MSKCAKALLFMLALVVYLLASTGPAESRSGGTATCAVIDPVTKQCTIWASDGGSARGDIGSHGGGRGSSSCMNGGTKTPCSTAAGSWSSAHNCYVKAVQPNPGPDDPRWPGQFIGGNQLYSCIFGTGTSFFSAPVAAVVVVDPVNVARDAIAKMNLHAITVGIAPKAPPGYGLVGLPVWMWATNPGPSTVGPLSTSATTGPVTVTAKAALTTEDWSMGDGHSVVCHGAGSQYSPTFGNTMSPTCGYRYTRASTSTVGGVYHVAATSHWTITWAGGGATGTVHLTFTSRAQVQIRELQVVVTH